ncbi:hypothetical protein BN1723_004089, partial [Verticillium longisporum]
MKSWLPIPVSSHFSLKNIPFGIISTASNAHHRPAVAVGEHYLQDVFREDTPYPELLKTNDTLRQTALVALADAQTHLPLSIGDYTDFFAGAALRRTLLSRNKALLDF